MNNSKTLALLLTAVLGAASSLAWAGGDPTLGQQRTEQLGCAACHGPEGHGANPPVANAPRLAGQYADYLVRALEQYRNGERKNPIMAGMAANLSDEDRANIAAFFSSQRGLHTLTR